MKKAPENRSPNPIAIAPARAGYPPKWMAGTMDASKLAGIPMPPCLPTEAGNQTLMRNWTPALAGATITARRVVSAADAGLYASPLTSSTSHPGLRRG
jgi:hypothetical protein